MYSTAKIILRMNVRFFLYVLSFYLVSNVLASPISETGSLQA